MERYARCIVYRSWGRDLPASYRPVASFDTLWDAVIYADAVLLGDGDDFIKVIDVENLEMGDMLTAEDCAPMVKRIREHTAAIG